MIVWVGLPFTFKIIQDFHFIGKFSVNFKKNQFQAKVIFKLQK